MFFWRSTIFGVLKVKKHSGPAGYDQGAITRHRRWSASTTTSSYPRSGHIFLFPIRAGGFNFSLTSTKSGAGAAWVRIGTPMLRPHQSLELDEIVKKLNRTWGCKLDLTDFAPPGPRKGPEESVKPARSLRWGGAAPAQAGMCRPSNSWGSDHHTNR